jgi:hypothetical protein
VKVTLAVLADYANVSLEGKLNIMGIFDVLIAQSLPAHHPQMHLVARFQSEPAERGMTKVVSYKLLDADGRVLVSFDQPIIIAENAPAQADIPQIAALNGLTFEKYGDYAFHILINQDTKERVHFRVIPPPTEAQGG